MALRVTKRAMTPGEHTHLVLTPSWFSTGHWLLRRDKARGDDLAPFEGTGAVDSIKGLKILRQPDSYVAQAIETVARVPLTSLLHWEATELAYQGYRLYITVLGDVLAWREADGRLANLPSLAVKAKAALACRKQRSAWVSDVELGPLGDPERLRGPASGKQFCLLDSDNKPMAVVMPAQIKVLARVKEALAGALEARDYGLPD